VTRVAVLHAGGTFARSFVASIKSAADSVGVRMQAVSVRDESEIDEAFATMVEEQAGAVIIQPRLEQRDVRPSLR
jgi:DNA-binding LacI/PurR family transcriptional regulator